MLWSRLLPKGTVPGLSYNIPEDKRAVTVAVNEVIGVAGFIKPGDKVDVIATFAFDPPQSTTILQNVTVLAIAQEMQSDAEQKAKLSTSVTFALSPSQAERLVLAESLGEIRLALRPPQAVGIASAKGTTAHDIVPLAYSKHGDTLAERHEVASKSEPAQASSSSAPVALPLDMKDGIEIEIYRGQGGRCSWFMNRPGACVRFLLIVLSMQLLVSGSAFAYDEQLILVQGQSRILRLDDIVRAAVGDPAVVDVAAVDSQQLLLNPLRVGITSLHVWQRTRQKEYQLRVVADDGTLLQEFLTVLNLPHVSAWFAHGHLVLEGQVSSESEKERAEKLAGAYADAVISLLRHPTDDSSQQLKQELRRLIPPEIQLTFLQSTVILEGRAESDAERHLACRLAEALGYQVIDLIEVDSEPDAGIAAPAALSRRTPTARPNLPCLRRRSKRPSAMT